MTLENSYAYQVLFFGLWHVIAILLCGLILIRFVVIHPFLARRGEEKWYDLFSCTVFWYSGFNKYGAMQKQEERSRTPYRIIRTMLIILAVCSIAWLPVCLLPEILKVFK